MRTPHEPEPAPAQKDDPQNEPRTCPYCDQPRQDTFENRLRFECGTSLRADDHKTVKQGVACRLRVELRAAQAEAGRFRAELENFINANPRKWEDQADQFEQWVKSRARAALKEGQP